MEEETAARKRYSVEQIIAKLREAERLQTRGSRFLRPINAFRYPIRPSIAGDSSTAR